MSTSVGPLESRAVSDEVVEAQVQKLRADLWVPLVFLVPVFVFALVMGNLPAAAFLGASIAAVAAVAVHRTRSPEAYLRAYTGPVADAIVRAGGLEAREDEDGVELRLRLIDAIDSVRPGRPTIGRIGRGIGLAVAFMAGLAGVGLLGSFSVGASLGGAVFGAAASLALDVWPKRRKAARAVAILERQLDELERGD